MEKVIKVEGMHCANCQRRVENALLQLGAKTVQVDLANGVVRAQVDADNQAVIDQIETLGFDVLSID